MLLRRLFVSGDIYGFVIPRIRLLRGILYGGH
jgi:hypothetical protein